MGRFVAAWAKLKSPPLPPDPHPMARPSQFNLAVAGLDGLRGVALFIGIFDAEDELTSIAAGIEPVKKSRARRLLRGGNRSGMERSVVRTDIFLNPVNLENPVYWFSYELSKPQADTRHQRGH